MGILDNPRHEKFAQELAKGKSATEAYKEAGYSGSPDTLRKNASRLMTNDDIQARVAELQERAAVRTEITIAGVTENLVRLAQKAEAIDAPAGFNVARAAWMDAAKLNGLVVEKREIRTGTLENLNADQRDALREAIEAIEALNRAETSDTGEPGPAGQPGPIEPVSPLH
jgi:Terminase small subunit